MSGTLALSGFDKDMRDLIRAMQDWGWSFRKTRHGAVGRAPDGETSLSVIQRPKPSDLRRARVTFARWLRDAHPEVVETVDSALTEDPATPADLLSVMIPPGLKPREDLDEIRTEIITEDILQRRRKTPAPDPAPDAPEEAPMPVASAPTVTETKPWRAKKQPGRRAGKTYDSAAVMERHWSTGRVDYVCSTEGCDYASDSPRSVAAHYGAAHTRSGEGIDSVEAAKHVIPDASYTEPTTTREYHPTDRLIAALSHYLDAVEWETLEELAQHVLTWAHDRPDLPDVTAEPPRAYTDAEMVERIRIIVGQPLAVEVRTLTARVEELSTALEERTRERDQIAERLLRKQRDFEAFAALAATLQEES